MMMLQYIPLNQSILRCINRSKVKKDQVREIIRELTRSFLLQTREISLEEITKHKLDFQIAVLQGTTDYFNHLLKEPIYDTTRNTQNSP